MISPVRNPVKLPRRAEDTPLYFVRESAAYRADGTQVIANIPRLETGKFGKAIMVEEGTTNLLKNASFETGTADGWTLSGTNMTVQSTEKRSGSYALRIVDTSTSASEYAYQIVSATAGTVYTLSAYAKMVSGTQDLYLDFLDSTGARIAAYFISFSETTWTRKSITQTAPADTASIKVWLYSDVSNTYDGYWDDMQLEAKAYPTSIIFANDATTQPTRSPETLTIPTAGVLNPQEGTVKGFVNLWRAPGTTAQYIFDGAGAVNQNLVVYVGTDGKLRLEYGDGASMITLVGSTVLQKDTWYSVAWRWSSSGVELLLNGNLEASNINLPSLSFGANACLGSKADGTAQLDGLLDNFSVSGRVVPNVEVLEEYRSSMPKYSDEWTTALVM
jgi:hypothetical protein